MRRAGLIGDPVAHSLSPVMHNAAFKALGLDIAYELYPTSLDALPDRIESLRAPELVGLNVTVPHKQAVMPLCDELTETARRIGAVNTLIRLDGNRWLGDNTDASGFARALEGAVTSVPETAVLLGAGGAARAVAVALLDQGVASLLIANRTPAHAAKLVATLNEGGSDRARAVDWHDLPRAIVYADLLVNATSLGWHGDESPLDSTLIAMLDVRATVVDLTYRETALLRQAASRGLVTVDGLEMLLYQGVRALELWLGISPPVDVMRAAMIAEQQRRAG